VTDYTEIFTTHLQRHQPTRWAALQTDPENAERQLAATGREISDQVDLAQRQVLDRWAQTPTSPTSPPAAQAAAQARRVAEELVLADWLGPDEQTQAETDESGAYTGWEDGEEPLISDWSTLFGAPALDRFSPQTQADLAPAGQRAKAAANLAALRVLHDLDRDDRPATSQEQAVLARWAGWGSLPQVFDLLNTAWLGVGDELRDLLSDADYQAARASTLNAHYTSVDVAAAMWRLAADLGFAQGRVLEPGCGAGAFLGLAPAGAQLVGVEVEPTTGRIAAALHPHAQVRVEGFETTRLPAGTFDLAIGNVPFGDYPLHDPVHNPGNRHSIHNHFLIKSLDLVRPGGLAVLLTSRYTLDSADPTARRALAAAGDLLGAVRLPSNAFAASAGTAVVTDLLVLRRRHDHEPPLPVAWEHAAPIEVDGGRVTVNEWYAQHPELVLGTPQSRHGMYGPGDLVVKPHARPLTDALANAAAAVAGRARDAGRTLSLLPAPASDGVGRNPRRSSGVAAAVPSGAAALNEGAFLVDRSGQVRRVQGGLAEPCTVRPARDLAELRALVGLRDTAKQLLAVQADDPVDAAEVAAGQQRLHRLYDAYTARYGPLNRFTLVERGRDPETGEPVTRRRYPTMGGFRTDPDYHLVLALEVFDPDAQYRGQGTDL